MHRLESSYTQMYSPAPSPVSRRGILVASSRRGILVASFSLGLRVGIYIILTNRPIQEYYCKNIACRILSVVQRKDEPDREIN